MSIPWYSRSFTVSRPPQSITLLAVFWVGTVFLSLDIWESSGPFHCSGFFSSAAPLEDRVPLLPGWGPPPTPHYSGFLDATEGCDTDVNGAYCRLHYYLCTSTSANNNNNTTSDNERQPDKHENFNSTTPLVIWFNGGPGASSLVGLFTEIGPLLINSDAKGRGNLLTMNPYAWTNVAHLLVLESPVGVGYSHCQEQQDGGGICHNTDRTTATAAKAALDSFFMKFPELTDADVFLTGESYAGVYLPTLAYEILQPHTTTTDEDNPPATIPNIRRVSTKKPIRLQGMAVGDPCTDNTAQRESMDPLWYSHKYGLVDDDVYDTLRSLACATTTHRRLQHLLLQDENENLFKLVIQKRQKSSIHQQRNSMSTASQLLDQPAQNATPHRSEDDKCTLAYRKFLASSSLGISGKWSNRFVDRFSLFGPVTDAGNMALELYMNRPDVRRAMHMEDAPVDYWTIHAVDFDYTKEYAACNHFVTKNDTVSMIDFYRKIVPLLRVTWIYNGDTDPAVSYEGTRTAAKRVGFAERDGGGYRPWFINHTATDTSTLQEKPLLFGPDLSFQATGVQLGGEVVNYEHNLSFLTVHGSGHMVPQARPQVALHMLKKLLFNRDLSPWMPDNATLAAMNMHTFYMELDVWTELAKSALYVS